jgi:hypothetical protein
MAKAVAEMLRAASGDCTRITKYGGEVEIRERTASGR